MRRGWIIALSSLGGLLVLVAAVIGGILIGTTLGLNALSSGAWGGSGGSGGSSSSGSSSTTDTGMGSGEVPTRSDEDFGTVEVYTVLPDGTLDPQATGLTAEVWDLFARMTQGQIADGLVAEFIVGDAPDSDTLAYVVPLDDPTRWALAANLATAEDPQLLLSTLIHEFAHILTLRTDEIGPFVAQCDTVDLDEGCANPDAVITAFEERFWDPYGDAAPPTWNSDPDVAWEFYLEHEEDFVSDYAATNVAEDIAESFMTYVLEDGATGDSLAAQKLRFFDEFPEYVQLREHIRAEFATELGL